MIFLNAQIGTYVQYCIIYTQSKARTTISGHVYGTCTSSSWNYLLEFEHQGVIKPRSVSFHPSVNAVFPLLYCMNVAKQIHPRRNFGLRWSRGVFSVWQMACARVAAPLSCFFFPMYVVDARNSIIVYIFLQISRLYLTMVRFRVRNFREVLVQPLHRINGD